MATDLNLHRKTAVTSQDTQEGRTRDIEVRNRERTWILCFVLDRSFSAQMGKPSSIKEEYVIDFFFHHLLTRVPAISYDIHTSGTRLQGRTSGISLLQDTLFVFCLSCESVSSCYKIRCSNGYSPGVWSSCIAELNLPLGCLSIVTTCW